MFGDDRGQMRKVYIDAWRKHRQGSPLEPMEMMVVETIAHHPEYHDLLADEEEALNRDFDPETGESNPFLHMGMHLAIREQVQTDRPAGINAIYRQQLSKQQDPHRVEHMMMECLARALWEAQGKGGMPDEQAYLECLRRLS